MGLSRLADAELLAYLTAIGPPVRRAMLEMYNRDSCIGATRIAISLLERQGIDAYALSVTCAVFNKAFIERVEGAGRWPESVTEREQWHAESGAHSIGVGHGGDMGPDKWPGHLVAIVQRRCLWDLSIDQAERPQYDMLFPTPLVVPMWAAPGGPEPFLRGRERMIGNVGECMLV
jgi:hypothetical protein